MDDLNVPFLIVENLLLDQLAIGRLVDKASKSS